MAISIPPLNTFMNNRYLKIINIPLVTQLIKQVSDAVKVDDKGKELEAQINQLIQNGPFKGYFEVEYIEKDQYQGFFLHNFTTPPRINVYELRGERATLNRIKNYQRAYDAIWESVESANNELHQLSK